MAHMYSNVYTMHSERIDHHGRPANWFLDFPAAYLDSLVADLKEIELVFQLEFGLAVYLTWGTLLGAMRDSDCSATLPVTGARHRW